MDEKKFKEIVDTAYDILWKLHEDGDVDIEQDAKVIRMLDCIDEELGR